MKKSSFKTEFEDGQGVIENISAGGCALKDIDVKLTLNEKILILLELDQADGEIEIGARVVRQDKGGVAVQFSDISDDNKQKLVKYFARIQRSSMST